MARHTVSITSDLVIINGDLHVLVVKRRNPPFQGHWALPGGYVDEGETFLEAAVRELKEETGLYVAGWKLRALMVRDKPDRDPRGRVISVPFRYYAGDNPGEVIAGDDATEVMWWPGLKKGLAFDHDLIVREALNGYI